MKFYDENLLPIPEMLVTRNLMLKLKKNADNISAVFLKGLDSYVVYKNGNIEKI